MMAKLFILFLLLFEIAAETNGQTNKHNENIDKQSDVPQNGNIRQENVQEDGLARIENKLDAILNQLTSGDTFICNVTVKHVVDEIGDVHEAITEDAVVQLVRQDQRSRRLVVHVPEEYHTCVKAYQDKPISSTAAQFSCLQRVLLDYQPVPDAQAQRRDEKLIRSLGHNKMKRGNQRDKRTRRVRKEYRTLTDTERERFHAAMQALFDSGIVAAFGRIHAETQYSAHKGVAFLPWHRVFITKFEDALQQVDPNVALPYWDCTIDRRLNRASDSILWTDQYFGNIEGSVTAGLAKGWTSNDGDLSRWCGSIAQLPSQAKFDALFEKCHIKNVSVPLAEKVTFEMLHNDVHAWVGGDMSAVDTAAYDPIFYMMHAYFDYKWEEFRAHQRTDCDVDPETDYPDDKELKAMASLFKEDYLGFVHGLEHPMDGIPEYTNRDGLSDYWTRVVYRYEPAPTCQNICGGSDLLYCNTEMNSCMPKTRDIPHEETAKLSSSKPDNFLRISRALNRMASRVPREQRDLYPISPENEIL